MKKLFEVASHLQAKLGAMGEEPPSFHTEEEPQEWQGYSLTEGEEPPIEDPSLTSEELDQMEENLTEKTLRQVDDRINSIREQLGQRLSSEDMELFTEAVNLSARLEEWRWMANQ